MDEIYTVLLDHDLHRSRKLDVLYDYVEDHLMAGHWETLDTFLSEAPVEQLEPSVAVGLLATTFIEKQQFSCWEDTVARVRAHLLTHEGFDEARVNACLAGFER